MKLIKGQIVKCKNIVLGKEIKCEIIDAKYNQDHAEVKLLEQFEGSYTVVNYKDIIIENQIKGSAAISFGKYEDINMFEEVEKRYISIDITTKSNIIENAEILLNNIIDKMESLDNNIKFSRCFAEMDTNSINDGFILEYEHGAAADTKDYIKDMFKQVKKELKIR